MAIAIKRHEKEFEVIFEPTFPYIYLDHWAIREISSNQDYRKRFLNKFGVSGTLLISNANIVEMLGNNKESLENIRQFFSEIKDNWFPLDINPIRVMEKEELPDIGVSPCYSHKFLKRFYNQLPDGRINLASVVDLVQENQAQEYEDLKSLKKEKSEEVMRLRERWKWDKSLAENIFTCRKFDPKKPQKYVFDSIMRIVLNADFPFKENDVLDFSHTVVSIAYGNVVLLDKKWADIFRKLKMPDNRLAVYTKPQIPEFLNTEFVGRKVS